MYDLFGNPSAYAPVIASTPAATDLLDGVVGCDCRTGPEGQGTWAMSLLALGLLARRRVRARSGAA